MYVKKYQKPSPEFIAELKRLYQDENLTVAQTAEALGIDKLKCQNIIKNYHLHKHTYVRVHRENGYADQEDPEIDVKHLIFAKEKQAHRVTVNGKKWIDLTEFYT